MIADPVPDREPVKQSQSDGEAKENRAEKSEASPNTEPGAKAKQENPPEAPNAEDYIKNNTGSDERSNLFNEFIRRAAREFPNVNFNFNLRSGGNDFNGPTHIEGDIAGRDTIKRAAAASAGNAADTGISGQVYAAEIEKIVNVYVETALYQRARKILHEKNLLILRGETDAGKRATAIRLLESFHRETIFEIAPTLDDLSRFHCRHQQGYLWNTPGGEKLERVSRFLLDQIGREHKDQNSHLVITLDKRFRLAPETARDYLLEWNERPEASAVLEKHLAWILENESEQVCERVSTLRQEERVRALINELDTPAKAGRLAELLVQTAHGDLPIEELLAAFENLDRQDAQMWFDSHKSLSRRLQMLALAILHGSSQHKIIEAGRELRVYLKLHTDEAAEFSTESEMNTGSKQWLAEMEAKTTIREISTEFGRDYIEAVVFKNQKFQPAVLAYAWEEFAEWRLPVLRWLRDQGESRSLETRLAAVVATSELSQYHAFRDVRQEVLSSWAMSDDPDQRRMAALALTLQALEKNLSSQALGLLHHWATISNPRLQWTTATAYGGELGVAYPELAMRDLFEVFLSNHPFLQIAVYNALRFLFNAGRQQPNLFAAVMRALDSWARDQRADQTAHKMAVLIFLRLSEIKVRVQEDGRTWPAILWLATVDETYAGQFRSLLKVSLTTSKVSREELLNKHLPDWLSEADRNEEIFKLLGRAFYDILKRREPGFALSHRVLYDRLERQEANEASESAGKLLTILKRAFPL